MKQELQTIRLVDYLPPAFLVSHHEMVFELRDNEVTVTHSQQFSRNANKYAENSEDLVLNGESLNLLSVKMNGEPLHESAYRYENNLLCIFDVPEQFELTTKVTVYPEKNFQLSGLYRSNGIYCTQCEAEGFRRISFTLDRPDVLATYRVRIEGNKEANPVMLSNGNLETHGELSGGRYFTQWFDPHPKPSYLFALVAGQLDYVEQKILTPLGKKVDLRIYTEPKFIRKTGYAMQSLIESFQWDENRFGLSYDLDCFNLVAISDFNMGAMENKSLNIFNTKYVIATVDSATDDDFRHVQAVIGHEYFHNWTGDRVTCRNWFQLSLKEGLTVFRDQEFSSDLNERNIERIGNVNVLRRVQFAEDAGPMRHPVQPQEYAAMDNFYTATVYEKGAEIIRMYHTIIGEENFQKGMKLYFERHDGQAVRIQEFAKAMEDASGFPFSGQFFDWYTTSGTPKLAFNSSYNAEAKTFTLHVSQDLTAVTPNRPLLIPIRLSLLQADRTLFSFEDGSDTKVMLLDKETDNWTFEAVNSEIIPVLMEGFSAPVYYNYDYSDAQLAEIVMHAPDGFARNEAMQICLRRLFTAAMEDAIGFREKAEFTARLMQNILTSNTFSSWEKSLLLGLPALPVFIPYLDKPLDIDKITAGYDRLQRTLAVKMHKSWAEFYANDTAETNVDYSVGDAGIRALRGVAMVNLALFEEDELRHQLLEAYQQSRNMTERMNALSALNQRADKHREEALQDFYQKFADQPLVIDKWFGIQAMDYSEGALARIKALAEHEAFSVRNPNRFRALIGTLMMSNPHVFHRADGKGYLFAISQIRRLLIDNPQIAARMLGGFAQVASLDEGRKAIVKRELINILSVEKLSIDVREVVERILSGLE